MKILSIALISVFCFSFIACSDDEVPESLNDEEFINKVELIFSPTEGEGAPVAVNALDADGLGSGSLVNSDSIRLKPNTAYELFVFFKNTIDDEDITTEVEAEGEEYMIFYAFSEGLFSSPDGDGNMDHRMDRINYLDRDDNGQPIGLTTSWVTGSSSNGNFELILKHQPDVKSAVSNAQDGATDISVSWGVVFAD